MRRFFSISFIALALLIGAAGAAPAAHAGPLPEGNACPQGSFWISERDRCEYDEFSPAELVTEDEAVAQDTAAAAARIAKDKAAARTVTELPKPPENSEGFSQIMIWIMSLFAWLVGVAAMTLDYAVYYTVVTMGDYVHNLSAVGVTWRILRDIGNIMLIFGFLAVGITTILNVDWYGGGKKMLPMMFVAAVFLNFSLFISEAIIDTGNLFATQFSTQINGGTPLTASFLDTLNPTNEGISNRIMGQLGLQTLYDTRTNVSVFKAGNSWIIGFMGILLFIITAFVMFSLAFVLIARFVALIFLIILSPVGFAGLAAPQLAKRAGQWWSKLFEQTITAPILLLMLYIALAVITDAQFLTGFCIPSAGSTNTSCTANWLGYIDGNFAGFASMILSFLVAMGLLLAVVIQSKNLSAFGASLASKAAGKLTFGATAFGLRSTAGWGSQGAAQAIRRSRIGGTKTGRLLATTFDKGAKASFDIRGATIGGGLKGIGVDAGDAAKGGYKARRDAAIKGHQDYVKSVGEAIDERGPTREQERVIANATAARALAEKEYNSATELHKTAKNRLDPQIEQQKAEVKRLKLKKEQEESSSPNMSADPETERKLAEAEKKLATSESILTAASTDLARAVQGFKDAREAETAAEKAPGDRNKEDKTKAQLQYAKNIGGSFPGWVVYGPGGAAAARKIVKDAKKTPEQVLVENLKKAVDQASKDEGKPAAEPKSDESHK